MKKYILKLLSAAFCFFLCCAACSDDNSRDNRGQTEWTTYKLAVILPYADGMQERWQRLAQWACATLEEAQTGMEHGVKPRPGGYVIRRS